MTKICFLHMFLSFLFFRHCLVHSLHSWAWQRARVVTDGSVLTRERSESHVKNVGAGGVMSLWQWWWKSGFNTVWIVFIMCVCAFWKKKLVKGWFLFVFVSIVRERNVILSCLFFLQAHVYHGNCYLPDGSSSMPIFLPAAARRYGLCNIKDIREK